MIDEGILGSKLLRNNPSLLRLLVEDGRDSPVLVFMKFHKIKNILRIARWTMNGLFMSLFADDSLHLFVRLCNLLADDAVYADLKDSILLYRFDRKRDARNGETEGLAKLDRRERSFFRNRHT